LIENGATIDLENRDGHTALIKAIAYKHNNIVERLILSGADVNKRNDGFTPLMLAAIINNTQAIKLLIENSADINARNIIKWIKNYLLLPKRL